MEVEYFVGKDSIVRKIWGRSDTILFIFAGASAEFSLNRAVDWLYFTGKLPADPLGRLFSTVTYARTIVFSEKDTAVRTIQRMTEIHAQVESNRGMRIPDWAYRDVLFMLIDYSIRAFEVLERKMSAQERCEVFQVFIRVGRLMGLTGLPSNYKQWVVMRKEHMHADLRHSQFKNDLFRQYRKHLGGFRYWVLVEAQKRTVPTHVRHLLGFNETSLLAPLILLYKISRRVSADGWIRSLILPSRFLQQLKVLDG